MVIVAGEEPVVLDFALATQRGGFTTDKSRFLAGECEFLVSWCHSLQFIIVRDLSVQILPTAQLPLGCRR